MILRVFRVLLVACVLLSACSSGGDDAATDTTADEPSTPSAPVASAPPTTAGAEVSGEPVVTEAQARKALRRVNKRQKRANAKKNSKQLRSFETEAAFTVDDAIFRVGRKLDPDNTDPLPEFEWVEPTFFIPGVVDGMDPWFVAEVAPSTSPESRYALVFTQEDGQGPWKVASYADVDDGLPELATGDNGEAVAVAPDDASGLDSAPADVAHDHADYLTEGEGSAAAERFAPDEHTSEIIDNAVLEGDLASAETIEREATVAEHPVRALRTADGGAVVFYAIDVLLRIRQPDSVIDAEGPMAALADDTMLTTPDGQDVFIVGMDLSYVDQWIAAVPAGGGPVELLGDTGGLVGVTGADPSEYPEDLPPEVQQVLDEQMGSGDGMAGGEDDDAGHGH